MRNSPVEVYGRLAVSGGQNLDSEVWGTGEFSITDGSYTWSARELFDGFHGTLEVGNGARFSPALVSDTFDLPDGRLRMAGGTLYLGVYADARVEGALYTYGQGYALGVFGTEKKALYEPEMSFEVHDGAGSVKIATVRYDAKSARTGDYGIKCHLFRSPSLAPWVESEVAEGSLGEAMQNDAGHSDKMFYTVKLEIKDKAPLR